MSTSPGHIRTLQTPQQVPPLGVGQGRLVAKELRQRLVVHQADVVLIFQGGALEGRPVDERGIQLRGQVGLPVARLLLVVELKVQPLAQELQRRLRISVITQQGRAIFDDAPAPGIRIALRPLLEKCGEFRGLPRILIMQRAEEIIVLRPGHELIEHRLAVRREGEFLDEADFIFRTRGKRSEQHGDSEAEGQSCFHRGKQGLNEVAAKSWSHPLAGAMIIG